MELIKAENIGKDYTVGEVTIRALDGVSFGIEPASFVSFVGSFRQWQNDSPESDRVPR